MLRIFILIYVLLATATAVYTTIVEIQPALFFIDLMAPHNGDRYSATLVVLLVMFLLLIPLLAVLLVFRIRRLRKPVHVDPHTTGIFVTRKKALQSALLAFPVYINGVKVGAVDNGKTQFFECVPGVFTIQVRRGGSASLELSGTLKRRDQIHYVLSVREEGLRAKFVLEELDKGLD
jgi:hypothetical protein